MAITLCATEFSGWLFVSWIYFRLSATLNVGSMTVLVVVRSRIMFNLFTVNKAISNSTGCVAHSAALIIDATFHVAKWWLISIKMVSISAVVLSFCCAKKKRRRFRYTFHKLLHGLCLRCVCAVCCAHRTSKMNEKMKTNWSG